MSGDWNGTPPFQSPSLDNNMSLILKGDVQCTPNLGFTHAKPEEPDLLSEVTGMDTDFMVRPDGFEPPTLWFEVKCSRSYYFIQSWLFQ